MKSVWHGVVHREKYFLVNTNRKQSYIFHEKQALKTTEHYRFFNSPVRSAQFLCIKPNEKVIQIQLCVVL